MSIQKKPSQAIEDRNVADWLDYIWTAFQGVFTFYKNVVFKGYTQLGDAGPKVKMKKLTGTTASIENDNVSVAHGLTGSKIIGLIAKVAHVTNGGLSPEFSASAGLQYSVNHDGTYVTIYNHATNSENILSKPFTVTVFYEE